MDSDTGGGKSKLDLSDIISMLGEGEQKKPEPKVAKKAEAPGDNAFAQKLMADIERKNAEILKLSSDNMSLKYALGEKEVEVKKLKAQVDGLGGQVESLKGQVIRLNQQVEDMNKYVNDARIKLGEMEADRAKLTAHAAKKEAEEEAPPGDDDLASIFKRISTGDEPSDGAGAVEKKLKTAKLYDL